MYSLSPTSRRTHFGRVAIALWVTVLHLAALWLVDAFDRKNATPTRQAVSPIQVRLLPPSPSPRALTKTAQTSEERHLPAATQKLRTTQRAVATVERPSRTRIEWSNPPDSSHPTRPDEVKVTRSAEATEAVDEPFSVREERYAPLDLSLPRQHADATVFDHRVFKGTNPKKSANQVFSEAIERAQRPDCRSAHAGAGVLAIPLLLADSISGRGCKW
ncbi:hypothetical protein [Ottowia thiooxydans]|uniref:Transmembrane protein n=1 Tax=Ottowia thiooxydans TaxID=219182 RepID=A0ABV2Q2R9_9BURK